MRDLLAPESSCPGFGLRRFHAGELIGAEAEAIRAHAARCGRCAAGLAALDEETATLRSRMPYTSFARDVEARLPRVRAQDAAPRRLRGLRTVVPLALAASLAAVIAVPLLRAAPPPVERTKGGAGAELIIGGAGPARTAGDGERLAPDERVRIRVLPGDNRYALALSVDEAGQVSVLYDDAGRSLAVAPGEPNLLPDSLAFEGEGAERVYVFLTPEPLAAAGLVRSLEEAHRAAGSVEAMGDVPSVPGEQTSLLLRKP